MGAQINAYNCIISGNTSSGIAADAGVYDGVEANRVMVKSSILGSSLTDANGSSAGGAFSAESMLGSFGLYDGGLTQCFPLIGTNNPAVDGGISNTELEELASTGFNPVIETELLLKDQNGTPRTKKSIGSYNSK